MLEDEARTLRRRHDDLLLEVDRGDSPPDPGNPSIVVRTVTNGAYPTTARSAFAVERCNVTGTESEGAGVTVGLVAGATVFYALNVGLKIPPQETNVIAELIGGRWVFQYDGPES